MKFCYDYIPVQAVSRWHAEWAWFHIQSQARGSVGLHAETGGSMGLDLWGLPGATPFTWEDNNAIKRTNLLNGGRRQTFRRTRHAKCSVRGVH